MQRYGSTATIKRVVFEEERPPPSLFLSPPRLPTLAGSRCSARRDSKVSAASTQTAAERSQKLQGDSLLGEKKRGWGGMRSDAFFSHFCNWANFSPSPRLASDSAEPNARREGGESAAKTGAKWQRQRGATVRSPVPFQMIGLLFFFFFQTVGLEISRKMFLSFVELCANCHI